MKITLKDIPFEYFVKWFYEYDEEEKEYVTDAVLFESKDLKKSIVAATTRQDKFSTENGVTKQVPFVRETARKKALTKLLSKTVFTKSERTQIWEQYLTRDNIKNSPIVKNKTKTLADLPFENK